MGFREVVAKHPGVYPLLERSLREEDPAMNPKVEWFVDNGSEEGNIALNASYNYTEIFRGPTAESVARKVETALLDGVRSIATSNHRTMGGARFLLGRDPEPSDEFKLRLLRDLHRRKIEDWPEEWLAELTVQIREPAAVTV